MEAKTKPMKLKFSSLGQALTTLKKTSYICKDCQENFDTDQELMKHMITQHLNQ